LSIVFKDSELSKNSTEQETSQEEKQKLEKLVQKHER